MYCSYCYGYGHSVRKCKKLREDAERGIWRARQRVDIWEEAAAKRKAAHASGDFQCSYCKNKGHRRNSCDLMKAHREKFVEILNAYRIERGPVLAACGLGKGSIISLGLKNWKNDVYEERKLLSLGWDESSIHPLSVRAYLSVYDTKTGTKSKIELSNPLLRREALESPLERVTVGWSSARIEIKRVSSTVFSDLFTQQTVKSTLVKKLFSTKPGKLNFPQDYGEYSLPIEHDRVSSFFDWLKQEGDNVF